MFNSKMYKKYYPIKSSFDIANMNVAEQKKTYLLDQVVVRRY